MTEKNRKAAELRTVEAFKGAPSLHPLVVGHMCKQDKNRHTFSKRYFALYQGGLLAYYTHQRAYEEDVTKNKGLVSVRACVPEHAELHTNCICAHNGTCMYAV